MDIKMEYESFLNLCHGCLSAERNTQLVTGEFSDIFYKLRNDDENQIQSEELLLCWECVAILKKLKTFQNRIRNAQLLLLDHLKAYSVKIGTISPSCLSSLTRTLNNTLNTVIYEEESLNRGEQSYFNKTNHLNKTQNLTKEKVIRRNLKRDKDEINYNEDNDKSGNTEDDSLEEEDKKIVLELKLEYDNIKQEENVFENENMERNDEYKDDDSRDDNPIDYCEIESKVKEEDCFTTEKKIKILPKVETYNCVNKRKKYAKFATITRNQNISTQNYKDICETVRLSQNEYENDVLKKERDRFGKRLKHKCEKCKDKFLKDIDLVRHISFYHNELGYPQKCAACKSTVQSSEKLSQHWTQAHSVMFKCTLCLELYRTVAEMKQHIRHVHIKIYTCNECACAFGSYLEFRKHYKSHESVICDHCGNKFGEKKTLITHMEYLHTPALCRICNQPFLNHKNLKNHNKMYHPEMAKVDTTEELSYCVECDKQFPSVLKYRRHLLESIKHNQKKKIRVPCPECGKIFSKKNFMNNHYKFAHLKMTKNYCEKCEKYFTTGFILRQHIERVHKKIPLPKTKVCDICGRAFGTNKILENHRRTHTGEKPFKCVYCPASFAQKTAMMSHQKTQHKPDKLI